MPIIRSVALVGMTCCLLAAASPASASCFINSYCSNSYDKEYNSSSCRWQRDSCNSQSSTIPTPPSRSFGAIAFSSSSGDYGYSDQFGSRGLAERRAMRECGKKDCKVATWFYNSCGAVAADADGTWGGAQGGTQQQAKKVAQARCAREGGKNCQIVYAHCSR